MARVDVPRTAIEVFLPGGRRGRRCRSCRWSRRRAATVAVCAARGEIFDDAQRACKAPFADNAPKAFLKLKVHTFVCESDLFRPVDPTGGLLYLCL